MSMTSERPVEHLQFTVSDGVSLAVRRYPVERPAVVVLAMHGLQSHAGWYDWSCRFFQSNGIEVWFADRRGSGLSGGVRGHARSSDRLVSDVRCLLQAIRGARSGTPCVLMGVCWAAKLVVRVASVAPVEGLALLYPALRTHFDPSWRQRALLRLSKSLGLDRRRVVSPLRTEHFTRDESARRMIDADPLAVRSMTLALVRADQSLRETAADSLATTRCPILVVLSGRDRVANNRLVERLIQDHVAGPVTWQTAPKADHVLEFESDRDEIFEPIVVWLRRLAAAESPNPPSIRDTDKEVPCSVCSP